MPCSPEIVPEIQARKQGSGLPSLAGAHPPSRQRSCGVLAGSARCALKSAATLESPVLSCQAHALMGQIEGGRTGATGVPTRHTCARESLWNNCATAFTEKS